MAWEEVDYDPFSESSGGWEPVDYDPFQKDEGLWEGFVKPTLKAIPKVVGTAAAGLASMPIAGLTGLAVGSLAALEGRDAFAEANQAMESVSGRGNLVETPEEQAGLENIMIAMKPFQMAGEGWRRIGEATGIPYAEPALGTIGETAAMLGLPAGIGKGVRNVKSQVRSLESNLKFGDEPLPSTSRPVQIPEEPQRVFETEEQVKVKPTAKEGTTKIAEESPYKGYREVSPDEVLEPGADVKMDMETGKNYVREESQKTETQKVETPEPTEPTGSTPSSIAKSIEAKAIEKGFIEDGFDQLAGFDSTTMKAQAKGAADLLNSGVDNARKVIRGEEPLPEGIRGISVIKAMEEHIKTVEDPKVQADLAHELANSKYASEVSEAGQLLSVTRGRELDSYSARIAGLKKARESQAGKSVTRTKEVREKLNQETNRVNLPKEELSWDRFLNSIKC